MFERPVSWFQMRFLIRASGLFYLLAPVLLAQAQPPGIPPAQSDSIRLLMSESIRRQRESVETQLRSSRIAGEWQPTAPPAPVPGTLTRPATLFTDVPEVCAPMPSRSLDPEIQAAAQEQGLSPDLLRALIAVESASMPCAVSSKGALGLMQLMPGTAQILGVANPFDPKQNLAGGAKYLSHLLARYGGDLRLALGAYNAGPALVDKHGDVPPIPETQRYVLEILKRLGSASTITPVHPAPLPR